MGGGKQHSQFQDFKVSDELIDAMKRNKGRDARLEVPLLGLRQHYFVTK